MSQVDEGPILELGTAPIAGGAPAGIDAADDPDYILVAAELAKADRIDADPPEWHEVERAATDVLRLKSKDIEMACSLSLALFRRDGYAGFSAGLAMIGAMLENFWDGMFPERLRRRKNTIESMVEKFTEGGWFSDEQHKPDDYDALDACMQRIEAIEATLKAKMPDEPPDFGKFKRALRDYAAQRPKADAPPPPPPQPAAGSGAAPAAAPASAAAGGVAVGEITDRSGAVKTVLATATYLRKADLADPLSYALVRSVKWSTVTLPPDSARDSIDPPEKTTIEGLTFQFAESQWENLLKNAEASFRAGHPLWLDVQRYACVAMASLGANYDRARQAILSALAGLVKRLGSGVYSLQFRGGMPLTSGETKLWIEKEVAAPASSKSGGASAGGNGKMTEATDKARELAGTGKLKEAIELLTEGLNTASQKRDRLLWQLCIAQLCSDAQRLSLAVHMLDQCSKEIRQYKIDEWEPTLAVEVAQTLYRCRRNLVMLEKQPGAELVDAARDAYAWLCQLDPMAAFEVEPPGK